ncbi:hypothetical protein C8R43DRAFT_183409 [Mycena crocata]|nr:hypothetical protein C8R43DRAFT_183409 [Mycena crocata]
MFADDGDKGGIYALSQDDESDVPALGARFLLRDREEQGARAATPTSTQAGPSNLHQKLPLQLEHLFKEQDMLAGTSGNAQGGPSKWQYKRARELVPAHVEAPSSKRPRYEDGPDNNRSAPDQLPNRYTPQTTSTTSLTPNSLAQLNSDVRDYIPAPPPEFRSSVNGGMSLTSPPNAVAPVKALVDTPSSTLVAEDDHVELDAFLKNVMGTDLSIHRDLLVRQGITMDSIRKMVKMRRDSRQIIHFAGSFTRYRHP